MSRHSTVPGQSVKWTMHLHHTRIATVVHPLSPRKCELCIGKCVYGESCKCDAYVMLVWFVTSSALPMTFTATTPCPCSSCVHPGQASTSLIIKDLVNDPTNYIFRSRRYSVDICNWQLMAYCICDRNRIGNFNLIKSCIIEYASVSRDKNKQSCKNINRIN